MKKVALYNPYLSSKGGGEKVCLALAESLQRDLKCQVYLVAHEKVDLNDLSAYFKLNLDGIQVILVDFHTLFFKLLRRVPLPGRVRNIFLDHRVLQTIRKQNFDVFINNCYQSNLPSPTKNGVYMCMFPQRLKGSQYSASALKRAYVVVANFLSRLILHPARKNPIDTYSLITANSAYTQSFIKSLWHKQSSILYPICENMLTRGIAKEKVILHVGRFFANDGESHHKRQDALVQAFAEMKDLHKAGWQLHLAGSVAEDVGALKYILQLMKAANGIPVFFHFNTPFSELNTLYNQASIYWHATGFGSDPNEHPEKQEHFGISTVEAMSTGAIPIVINSAGQKESVVPGENGYLWDTLDELRQQTTAVVNLDRKQLEKLASNAQQSAKQFNSKAFDAQVEDLFSELVG